MSDERVCIIFDTDFGEQLQTLDLRHPIWIIGSIKNDPCIRRLWLAAVGNITKFDAQDLDCLLPTIDEHCPLGESLRCKGWLASKSAPHLGPLEAAFLPKDQMRSYFGRPSPMIERVLVTKSWAVHKS